MRNLLEPEPVAPFMGRPAQQPGSPRSRSTQLPSPPGVYPVQEPGSRWVYPAHQPGAQSPPPAQPSSPAAPAAAALRAMPPVGLPRVHPRGPLQACGPMLGGDKGAGLPQASEISRDWSARGVPAEETLACSAADSQSHSHSCSHGYSQSHSQSHGQSIHRETHSRSHRHSHSQSRAHTRGHARSRSSSNMREGSGAVEPLAALRLPMEATTSGPAALASALQLRHDREREGGAPLVHPGLPGPAAAGGGSFQQQAERDREGGRLLPQGSSPLHRTAEKGGVPPTLLPSQGSSGEQAQALALASALLQRGERREQRRREREMRRGSLGARTSSMSDGTMDWLRVEDLLAGGIPLHPPGAPPKPPPQQPPQPPTGVPPLLACMPSSPPPAPVQGRHTAGVPLFFPSGALALADPSGAPTDAANPATSSALAQPGSGVPGSGLVEARRRKCLAGLERSAGMPGGELSAVGVAGGAPMAPRVGMAAGQGPLRSHGRRAALQPLQPLLLGARTANESAPGFLLWDEDVEEEEESPSCLPGSLSASAAVGVGVGVRVTAPDPAEAIADCDPDWTQRGFRRTLGRQEESELREALVRSLSENGPGGHLRHTGGHPGERPQFIGRTKSDQPGSGARRGAGRRGYSPGASTVYRGRGFGAGGSEIEREVVREGEREIEGEREREGGREGAWDLRQEGALGESFRRSMPPRPPSTLVPRRDRRRAPPHAGPGPPISPPPPPHTSPPPPPHTSPPPPPHTPPPPPCCTTPPPSPPLRAPPAAGAPPLGSGSPGTPFPACTGEDLPRSRSANTPIGPGYTGGLPGQEGGTGVRHLWHSPGPLRHGRSHGRTSPALAGWGAPPANSTRPLGDPSRSGVEELAELQRVIEIQRERKREAQRQTQRQVQRVQRRRSSSWGNGAEMAHAELPPGGSPPPPEPGSVSHFELAWVASEGHRMTPTLAAAPPALGTAPLATVTAPADILLPSLTGPAATTSSDAAADSHPRAPVPAPAPTAPGFPPIPAAAIDTPTTAAAASAAALAPPSASASPSAAATCEPIAQVVLSIPVACPSEGDPQAGSPGGGRVWANLQRLARPWKPLERRESGASSGGEEPGTPRAAQGGCRGGASPRAVPRAVSVGTPGANPSQSWSPNAGSPLRTPKASSTGTPKGVGAEGASRKSFLGVPLLTSQNPLADADKCREGGLKRHTQNVQKALDMTL